MQREFKIMPFSMTTKNSEVSIMVFSNGFNISTLNRGTILRVKTMNSEYVIQLLEKNKVLVQGGKYFEQPTKAVFKGSTWGGSMLKLEWIGKNMSMEFGYSLKNGLDTVLTSGVQAVKVIPEDGITFLLEWEPQASDA